MGTTVERFIAKEVSIWGEDEIFRLIDDGYTPVVTDDDTVKWLAPVPVKERAHECSYNY